MASAINLKCVVLISYILWFLCAGFAYEDIDSSYDLMCSSDSEGYSCQCPYDDTTSEVNCSSRQIAELYTDISFPSMVREVMLKNNQIRSIPSNVFAHGIGVTSLDLSRNVINFLASAAFLELGNLERLDLSHNAIWNIGVDVFDGLSNLETLDLSYNNIGNFFGEVFKPCENLKVFILKYNPLMYLDDNRFTYLKYLEKLDLQSTGVAFLPENVFFNNTALKELILSANAFKEVPKENLQKLKNLQYLDLSQNPIAAIRTGDFHGMVNLKTLVLSNMNRLTHIDDHSMTKLPGLEELLMSHNPQLERISPNAFKEIRDHSNLGDQTASTITIRRLHLKHNNLQTLPETLIKWNDLDEVEVQDNPWNCDCHIKWMATKILRPAVRNKLACSSPSRLQGRKFQSLGPTDFSCEYLTPAAIIGLSLLILGAFSLALSGSAFLIYRHKLCTCWRARKQNGYARVISSKERVDLEWDHAGEPSKEA